MELIDYTVSPVPAFQLPADSERKDLKIGDHVKVTFCRQGTLSDIWVRITKILSPGAYRGKLQNQSAHHVPKAERAHFIVFSWNHVIDISMLCRVINSRKVWPECYHDLVAYPRNTMSWIEQLVKSSNHPAELTGAFDEAMQHINITRELIHAGKMEGHEVDILRESDAALRCFPELLEAEQNKFDPNVIEKFAAEYPNIQNKEYSTWATLYMVMHPPAESESRMVSSISHRKDRI
jgi:hypothetical protein